MPSSAPFSVSSSAAGAGLAGAARRSLDAVLYSSTWLALAALGLTWATFLHWRVHIPPRLGGLVFAATLFLYNLDSVLPYKHQQAVGLSGRKRWIRAHRRELLALALVALGVAGTLFWLDDWPRLLGFSTHLLLISGLYSWPLVRVRGRWRALRDLPLLKVFLLAYVWAAVTVWLPALYLGRPLGAPVVLALFARRFLFVLALALVFDIRDYTKDRLTGTRTFPGVFGVQATKLLALGALLAAAAIAPPGLPAPTQAALLVPLAAAAVVIWLAEESRPDYYFALLADGVLLLQVVVVWLLR
ncbi:UbiA prenyltransferase family protein [Hymenobacter weizhouensis]|uniref:hypothetical protein n=1 Tax=Hymenobacter sp. YIM 151500-1 TaxID=2987689 RepID=UPI0022268605|nr:hypothetical protein [Hymenobacter sp. YIM 151500-1]UYZ61903.1 hypothetical protein OIS53_12930 [Hymenobacter sp. YIM 151500-1]